MVIDEKNKFIFIHVSKTAGTSITRVFRNTWNRDFPKHVTFNDLPEWRNKYFSFGFIRNPWDRAVSTYNYFMSKRKASNNSNRTFEEFIQSYQTHDGVGSTQCPIVDGCSFIGRFEHLQTDFNEICKLMGIKRTRLQHRNRSNHKHYTELYTPELKDIIEKASIADIEKFGFTFEGTATKNIGDLRGHC